MAGARRSVAERHATRDGRARRDLAANQRLGPSWHDHVVSGSIFAQGQVPPVIGSAPSRWTSRILLAASRPIRDSWTDWQPDSEFPVMRPFPSRANLLIEAPDRGSHGGAGRSCRRRCCACSQACRRARCALRSSTHRDRAELWRVQYGTSADFDPISRPIKCGQIPREIEDRLADLRFTWRRVTQKISFETSIRRSRPTTRLRARWRALSRAGRRRLSQHLDEQGRGSTRRDYRRRHSLRCSGARCHRSVEADAPGFRSRRTPPALRRVEVGRSRLAWDDADLVACRSRSNPRCRR